MLCGGHALSDDVGSWCVWNYVNSGQDKFYKLWQTKKLLSRAYKHVYPRCRPTCEEMCTILSYSINTAQTGQGSRPIKLCCCQRQKFIIIQLILVFITGCVCSGCIKHIAVLASAACMCVRSIRPYCCRIRQCNTDMDQDALAGTVTNMIFD